MELSIIIPCYNEEQRIEASLRAVRTEFPQAEVIVVNDGSHDGTVGEVQKRRDLKLVSYATNMGKGYAIAQGIRAASKPWVLVMDADLSTPLEEYSTLAEHASHDIIIGSRALAGSVILQRQPWLRENMGKAFNRLIRFALDVPWKDTQCGFKLFRRDVAVDLFSHLTRHGFAFDVEMLYLAQKKGYKIREVPVQWKNCPESKVRLFRDSARMLWDVTAITINVWRRNYE